MLNADVIDLYQRVPKNARVKVIQVLSRGQIIKCEHRLMMAAARSQIVARQSSRSRMLFA
jgi:hypothetical protein